MRRGILIKSSFLFLFFLLGLKTSHAQQSEENQGIKPEQEIFGIWRFNLSEQKEKLSSENRSQISQLKEEEQDKFWMKTDSWNYVFEENGRVTLSWVDDGVYNESRGNWTFDSVPMSLKLLLKDEILEYRVAFTEKGMVWIPLTKSEEFLNVMYLKSLVQ
jgi:hypothetical protein